MRVLKVVLRWRQCSCLSGSLAVSPCVTSMSALCSRCVSTSKWSHRFGAVRERLHVPSFLCRYISWLGVKRFGQLASCRGLGRRQMGNNQYSTSRVCQTAVESEVLDVPWHARQSLFADPHRPSRFPPHSSPCRLHEDLPLAERRRAVSLGNPRWFHRNNTLSGRSNPLRIRSDRTCKRNV